jgi:GNAT superfamily N-acetyltransferase
VHIAVVGEADLPDLLPLMRAYCDFYEAAPIDERLLALARALIDDPDCEGFQIIARNGQGAAVGFATVYWCWSTLRAARRAIMNDLFVRPDARGSGVAEALIEAWPGPQSRRGRVVAGLADGEGQPAGPAGLRAGRGHARGMGRLLARHLVPRNLSQRPGGPGSIRPLVPRKLGTRAK